MNIGNLSKKELLTIIYTQVPDIQMYSAQPCYCMACKKDYPGNFLLFKDMEGNNKVIVPVKYLCDNCREKYENTLYDND